MRKHIFFMGFILVFIVACYVYLWWATENEYEKGYSECKDIGGEFIVVDKKWRENSNSNINVYGCVIK